MVNSRSRVPVLELGKPPGILSGVQGQEGAAALSRVRGQCGRQNQPIIIQPLLRGPMGRQMGPDSGPTSTPKMGMTPCGASGSNLLQGQVQVPLKSEQTLQGSLPLLNT